VALFLGWLIVGETITLPHRHRRRGHPEGGHSGDHRAAPDAGASPDPIPAPASLIVPAFRWSLPLHFAATIADRFAFQLALAFSVSNMSHTQTRFVQNISAHASRAVLAGHAGTRLPCDGSFVLAVARRIFIAASFRARRAGAAAQRYFFSHARRRQKREGYRPCLRLPPE